MNNLIRTESSESSECLFRQKQVANPKVTNLIVSLEIHFIEIKIISKAIEAFFNKNLLLFDSTVGDRKCQTRASMIVDLIENEQLLKDEFEKERDNINQIFLKTTNLLNKIKNLKHAELKELSEELQASSIDEYLKKHNLTYKPSFNLKLISLCYFTTLPLDQMMAETDHLLSLNKLNKLLISAKKELCLLSINYEQAISQKYDCQTNTLCLQQIETKGICSMTSFYNSFRSILKKMKDRNQSFIKKTILFCSCGGIQKKVTKYFTPSENKFIEHSINELTEQAIMIIEGYQFPGSLPQLKQILNVPEEEAYIPPAYQKSCLCKTPSESQTLQDAEAAILAFFAQHPQFTNNAEIQFDNQDLLNSDLHQEYNYFKSLPGFCERDMSFLYLDHIYPSTIKNAFDQDQDFIANLIAQPSLNIISHQHINCPC